MPRRRHRRTGRITEVVLIALCAAIFGVLLWMAAG